MKWYDVEQISQHVTGITDVTGVRCFLVQGTERALLIDTGTGAGNLKDTVDALTTLPYQVVLTHGHVDHVGGAWAFDEVYLSPKDNDLVKYHVTLENQLGYIGAIAPQVLEEVKRQNAIGEAEYALQPLTDGMEFHLGELDVKAIEVTGHTQGMTCLLIKQERMLILGDACNGRVFLFDDEASSVVQYRESLNALLMIEASYDTALFSHGPALQSKDMVKGCIAVADEILEGKDDKIPFYFMGKTAYMAKAVQGDGISRQDGGIGNIVYK